MVEFAPRMTDAVALVGEYHCWSKCCRELDSGRGIFWYIVENPRMIWTPTDKRAYIQSSLERKVVGNNHQGEVCLAHVKQEFDRYSRIALSAERLRTSWQAKLRSQSGTLVALELHRRAWYDTPNPAISAIYRLPRMLKKPSDRAMAARIWVMLSLAYGAMGTPTFALKYIALVTQFWAIRATKLVFVFSFTVDSKQAPVARMYSSGSWWHQSHVAVSHLPIIWTCAMAPFGNSSSTYRRHISVLKIFQTIRHYHPILVDESNEGISGLIGSNCNPV